MSARRQHKPRVTDAALDRVARFMRTVGAKVAAVEVRPEGTMRIVTTDGADLTLPDDQENLDLELAKYRATRDGRGGSEGRA